MLIDSAENVVDALTKALYKEKFEPMRAKLMTIGNWVKLKELILMNSGLYIEGLIKLIDEGKCKLEKNEHFENQENQ